MKIHRHLVDQLIHSIVEIFSTGRPADKVLEKVLKNQRKWGSRDRKFFAESVYEIVRHARRLWVVAGGRRDDFGAEGFMTEEAAWNLWGVYQLEKTGELPDWPELDDVRPEHVKLTRAERESIPDWLDELGVREFGGGWDSLIRALNQPADVYLRVNTLKADRETVLRSLAEEGIQAVPVPGIEQGVRLTARKNVFITKAFKAGLFEVQDAASQTVAPLLAPKPGERVVDACAGAGGKTLHLAALMKNKGKILSLDIHEWKLKELKERARRDGVDIVETRVIDSSKTVKRLEGTADAVLLDVPCSGLGVLRRNPGTKWKLTAADIDQLVALQAEILASYSRMVKPGGRLVYATCSVFPRENEKQVQAFLASEAGRGWVLEEEQHHRPDREGFDGFYAARLARSRDEASPDKSSVES